MQGLTFGQAQMQKMTPDFFCKEKCLKTQHSTQLKHCVHYKSQVNLKFFPSGLCTAVLTLLSCFFSLLNVRLEGFQGKKAVLLMYV